METNPALWGLPVSLKRRIWWQWQITLTSQWVNTIEVHLSFTSQSSKSQQWLWFMRPLRGPDSIYLEPPPAQKTSEASLHDNSSIRWGPREHGGSTFPVSRAAIYCVYYFYFTPWFLKENIHFTKKDIEHLFLRLPPPTPIIKLIWFMWSNRYKNMFIWKSTDKAAMSLLIDFCHQSIFYSTFV